MRLIQAIGRGIPIEKRALGVPADWNCVRVAAAPRALVLAAQKAQHVRQEWQGIGGIPYCRVLRFDHQAIDVLEHHARNAGAGE